LPDCGGGGDGLQLTSS